VFGYFRASWTLRVDLLGDFFSRLLAHMDQQQATQVTPALRPEDADMQRLPWVDPSSFNPGYLMRVVDRMPQQGSQQPWQHTQDYWRDSQELPAARLDDGALVYGCSSQSAVQTMLSHEAIVEDIA
ncbi:MAG: FAD-containing monooxygenase EthA, partial [Comamonas sp.]